MTIQDQLRKPEGLRYRKGLFFGPSGSGKTVFLGSAGLDDRTAPTLVIDVDGSSSSLYGHPGEIRVIPARDMKDYDEIYEFLVGDANPFNSVSIDNLTESHFASLYGIVDTLSRAKERRQKLDLAELSVEESDYGKSLIQMRRFIRGFRDLDMHVFFTAQTHTSREPKEGLVRKPAAFGQLADELVGLFDITGFTTTADIPDDQDETKTHHGHLLILQNYPGIRAKIRTPFRVTAPDEIEFGDDNGVTLLFDALQIPHPVKENE